jgi:hypothetical protein
MNEAEIKEAVIVDEEHDYVRLPPPPAASPVQQVARAPAARLDLVLGLIERRPLAAAAAIFLALAAMHLLLLNIAGVASFIFIGDELFIAAGSNAVEIVMLAFVAYNIVLPTLTRSACVRAYDDLRPALAVDDAYFAKSRAALSDPFSLWRLCFGLFWAVILTPVFGDLFRAAVPGEAGGAALLTIWLYIRIALIFGLLGANITFIAMLHHRFQASTATQLRVDLFDQAPLQPVARYARNAALVLVVLLALAGPAVAQPEAMVASALILLLGMALTGLAVAGAMWGARRAIRAAKKIALQELQSYSRELWRRAYSDGRLTEAVAVPALGAMLTVRAEIVRLSDWPGGWSVFARIAALAVIPALTWFGGELISQAMQSLTL